MLGGDQVEKALDAEVCFPRGICMVHDWVFVKSSRIPLVGDANDHRGYPSKKKSRQHGQRRRKNGDAHKKSSSDKERGINTKNQTL